MSNPDFAAMRAVLVGDADAGLTDLAAQLEERGVEVIGLSESGPVSGRLALRPLLAQLVLRHGAANVIAEGGARLRMRPRPMPEKTTCRNRVPRINCDCIAVTRR